MKAHYKNRSRPFLSLVILLLLAIILIASIAPALAQTGSATSSVNASNHAPAVGEQIVVTINIDVTNVNAPDDALGSFTGSLDWNPAVLAHNSNSGIQAGFTGVVNPSSGNITFNGANATGATGDNTVLTITFDVIGAGSSALDLEYSAMAAATTFANLLPLLTVTEDQVDAVGVPVQHTLTMAVNPGGSGTSTPAVGDHDYDEGTIVDISASPASGYQFVNWTGDVADVNSPSTTVTVDGDKTVTANFDLIPPQQYTLTINTSGQGSVTLNPPGGTYDEGTVVELTADPDSGWQFDNWSGALSGSTNPQSITMDGNKTVTANFSEIPSGGSVTSSVNASDHSPTVGEQIVVTINIDVTNMNAPDDALGSFTGSMDWNPTVLAYNNDSDILAGFTGVVNPSSGHITFNGANATGATGNSTVLTITFDVIGAGSSTLDLEYSAMAAAVTFEDLLPFLTVNDDSVQASAGEYTLTVNTSGQGSVILNPPGGTYDDGTLVELTADPAEGWQFDNWSGDLGGSANPQSITMDGNKEVQANFSEIPPGGSATSSANASDHSPTVGEQIVVAINIDVTNMNAPDDALGSFTGSLDWNPAVLAYNSDSGILAGFTGVVNPSSGHIAFNGANATGATGDNTVLTITFDVIGPGSSDLDLGYSAMAAAVTFEDLLPFLTVNDDSVQASAGEYALTVNTSGQGSVTLSPPGGTYDEGTVVELTADPDSGWQFDNWSGALSGTTNPQSITMDSNKTVTANFSEIPTGGSATSSANASDHSPTVGEQIVVSINIDVTNMNDPDDALGSFTGSLDWNPAVLAYNSDSGILAGFTGAINDSSGHIAFNGANATGATGNNTVLTITFDVIGPGSSDLDLEYSAMAAAYTFEDLLPLLTVYDDSVQASPAEYTLTVNTNGQGSVTLNPPGGTYADGAVVQLTAEPDSGWQFDNWSGALSGTTNPQSITMDSNKTVTANFSEIPPVQYTLTVNTSGQGSVTLDPPDGTYDDGTVVKLTAVPASGWQFDNWSGALNGTTNPQSITMDSNKTVTANFSETPPGQYTLTVTTSGQGSVTLNPPGGTYTAGAVVQLTADPDSGWQFAGWGGALSGMTNPQSIIMDSNKTVTATFSQIPPQQYTLTVNTSGQGTVSLNPSGGTYDAGTVVQLTAVPAAGWQFDGWSGALSGSTNPQSITMDGDKTVTATFSQIPPGQYALTVYTNGQGSVTLSPPGGIYDEGTVVKLTAVPAAGWQFDGWFGDLSGTTNPQSITMDSNKTVTATFSQIPLEQYTLTINISGQGNVNLVPPGGIYDEGTVVKLTAVPASGWKFDGWSGDLSGSSNPQSITMDSDKTVTATFSQIPPGQYALTVYTNGQGSVTLSPPGGTYDEGTVVQLTAGPAAGWQFAGWFGDISGTANPQSITMDSNKTVSATFVEVQRWFFPIVASN